MKSAKNITRYSADELEGVLRREGSRTDWARVKAMSQADVERLADEEEGPLAPDWRETIVLAPPRPKLDVHIRLDPDVVAWFKSQGRGYQTRINAVLKAFVSAQPMADPKTSGARGRKVA